MVQVGRVVRLLLLASALCGCGLLLPRPLTAEDPVGALPFSSKGYALYSWRVRGSWYFTPITGTDRLKTYDEITAAPNLVDEQGWTKVTVRGREDLKLLLASLPAGEQLTWVGPGWWREVGGDGPGFALPRKAVIEEISEVCTALSIWLDVTE